VGGLELEAAGDGPDGDLGGLGLATAWRPRVRALVLDDLELVDPPAGCWVEGASLGARALAWLRRAPEIELSIRHAFGAAGEGDALSGARSRWRREIELARGIDGLSASARATMYSRISICRWEIAHVEEGHTSGGTEHA
jgi:hypothetical protein